MKDSVRKEVEQIIKDKNFTCSVEKFGYTVSWYNIIRYTKLSEDFIMEFLSRLHLNWIAMHQKVSDAFIRRYFSEEQKKMQLKYNPTRKQTKKKDILKQLEQIRKRITNR